MQLPSFSTVFPHVKTFSLYVLSGGAAAIADFGSYFVLLWLGVWYLAASVIGNVLGFFMAFFLHKYVVYKKRSAFMKHLFRYFVIDMVNMAVISGLLFVLVDVGGVDPRPAKFIAFAPVLLWNFFIYKFAVYV